MVSASAIALYQVRKPYTITKQRERWTEEEHQKFLDALKLYGRAWRRIEEHVGTKTAVQIRSHAQKFFSKLEREASTGGSVGQLKDIEIPPPRPKRKPNHPYPRKVGSGPSAMNEDMRASATTISSFSSMNSISMQPDVGNNYHKAATFTPYVKGVKSTTVAHDLQDLSHGSSSLIKSKESVKLFGKSVVVPSSERVAANTTEDILSDMGFHVNDSNKVTLFSRDLFFKEILTESETSTSKFDLKQRRGFLPYSKAVEKTSSTDTPRAKLNADMIVLESGIDALRSNEPNTGQPFMSKDIQVQGAIPCKGAKSNEDIDTNSNHCYKKQTLLQESVFHTVFSVKSPVQHTKSREYSENKDDSVKEGGTPFEVDGNQMADLSDDKGISDSIGASNNSSYSWLDNAPQYHSHLPVPPQLASGSTELFTHGTGTFGNPLLPYHLFQLMALHHPAAYGVMGWPGLMTKTENAKLSEPLCTGQGHINPNIYVEAGATAVAAATIAAASAWWALHGLMTPAYINPTNLAMHMCAGVPGGAEIGPSDGTSPIPVDHVEATECMEDQEQDQNPDAATDDDAISEDIVGSVSDDHSELSAQQEEEFTEWIKDSKTLKSATHETTRSEYCFPSSVISDCEASSFVENHLSPLATEDLYVNDTKRKRLQSPNSSADECNGRRGESRERSSSGSNTPRCGHQTRDPENLTTSGSDVSRNSLCPQKQSTVENVGGPTDLGFQDCANVMQIPEEIECKISKGKEAQRNFMQGDIGNGSVSKVILQGEGCLKMRFKSLEMGEKTRHKDRSGGDNGGKRFKSSAYDTEQWKEVSEEGRKAFQALFSHKTLPQTFSPLSTLAESKLEEYIIKKRSIKSPQLIKKLTPPDVEVARSSISENDEEVCCNTSYPLAQTGVYSKEVKPDEGAHFLEEMEMQKEQALCQEINAAPGRGKGRSPLSIKLKNRKMAGVLQAYQQGYREGNPSKVQNLLSSGKGVISAALSYRKGSNSTSSGFVPYQRPSMETMTSEKR